MLECHRIVLKSCLGDCRQYRCSSTSVMMMTHSAFGPAPRWLHYVNRQLVQACQVLPNQQPWLHTRIAGLQGGALCICSKAGPATMSGGPPVGKTESCTCCPAFETVVKVACAATLPTVPCSRGLETLAVTQPTSNCSPCAWRLQLSFCLAKETTLKLDTSRSVVGVTLSTRASVQTFVSLPLSRPQAIDRPV
jgi:hypothetical protein